VAEEAAGEQLSRTLRSGDFEAAGPLSAVYGATVQAGLAASTSLAQRLALAQTSLAFLNDQLHLARVLRAHLSSQIRDNSALFLYAAPDPENHCWELDA
jgi:hypothetical protein